MGLARIEVLKPGMMSTIQDGGRYGYRKRGIPPSGFLDAYAAREANRLVGNPPNGPLIEMLAIGGEFKTNKRITIAASGADMDFTVNGKPMDLNKTHRVDSMSTLAFHSAKNGNATYLAIHGDWEMENALGSMSTFTKAKLGGLQGHALAAGDQITIAMARQPKLKSTPEYLIRKYRPGTKIRIVKGPECDDLIEKWLIGSAFAITPNFDRMGMQLKSMDITDTPPAILSCPVLSGIIQMPSGDSIIVVMPDGQTTGGYPRIAKIVDYDIPYLVQQNQGSTVRFVVVSQEEAMDLYRQYPLNQPKYSN